MRIGGADLGVINTVAFVVFHLTVEHSAMEVLQSSVITDFDRGTLTTDSYYQRAGILRKWVPAQLTHQFRALTIRLGASLQ